jgi:hypothetical protein
MCTENNGPYLDGQPVKVPLGRWLSIRSVDAVENRAVAKDSVICHIVKDLKKGDCPPVLARKRR